MKFYHKACRLYREEDFPFRRAFVFREAIKVKFFVFTIGIERDILGEPRDFLYKMQTIICLIPLLFCSYIT